MYAVDPRLFRYTVQPATPTTGATVIVDRMTTALWLNHSALIASLTIQLPPDPIDGQFFVVGAAQAVTAVLFTGGTVRGLLASLGINSFARYVFSVSDGVWFRAG